MTRANSRGKAMPKHTQNREVTSKKAASAASKVLRDPRSNKAAKTAAASALTQRRNKNYPLRRMVMAAVSRSTLVVHGRLAMREGRLAAARHGRHGLQIMSFEQAAVRLAGGFARPIDDESLRAAIQAVLPTTSMGELESIKALPGMIDAAVHTLHKAGRAGIDLAARAADHPRLGAIARLEAAVHDQLPSGMMRPLDIV